MVGGWLTALLNLLGMGGGGTPAPEDREPVFASVRLAPVVSAGARTAPVVTASVRLTPM